MLVPSKLPFQIQVNLVDNVWNDYHIFKSIQTYNTAIIKCDKTPKCTRWLFLGSIAVQNNASNMSWPNDENNLSPTLNYKIVSLWIKKSKFEDKHSIVTSNMLKNIYNLITDWLLITWYIIDVSHGNNIIKHVISIAIFIKLQISAGDNCFLLWLPLKKMYNKLYDYITVCKILTSILKRSYKLKI